MPLSQKQMEYLALAWMCFETEPKIDYEKFREMADLASAHSARELMRVTKKKLYAEYGTVSQSGHTNAAKAKNVANTPDKAAAGRKGSQTTGKSGGAKSTPNTKKTKTNTPQADVVDGDIRDREVEGDVDEDDDESPSKKRQRTTADPNSIKQEPDYDFVADSGLY